MAVAGRPGCRQPSIHHRPADLPPPRPPRSRRDHHGAEGEQGTPRSALLREWALGCSAARVLSLSRPQPCPCPGRQRTPCGASSDPAPAAPGRRDGQRRRGGELGNSSRGRVVQQLPAPGMGERSARRAMGAASARPTSRAASLGEPGTAAATAAPARRSSSPRRARGRGHAGAGGCRATSPLDIYSPKTNFDRV